MMIEGRKIICFGDTVSLNHDDIDGWMPGTGGAIGWRSLAGYRVGQHNISSHCLEQCTI